MPVLAKDFEVKFKSEAVQKEMLLKVIDDVLTKKHGSMDHVITDPDGDMKISVEVKRSIVGSQQMANKICDEYVLNAGWRRVTYICLDSASEVCFNDSWTAIRFYFYVKV